MGRRLFFSHIYFIKGGFWLGILTVISLLFTACSSEPRADLRIVNGPDPESLDPAIVTGQPDIRAAAGLFAGLTSPDPKTGRAIPCLAEKWDISEDGKVYTFYLRKGIRWSTGQPIVASDFVYSWERFLRPATGSRYANLLFPMVNAEEFNSGKITDVSLLGMKALDESTFRVELKVPVAYFLDLCATVMLAVVPPEAIEADPSQWIRKDPLPVSGAYCLERWHLNDRIRLKKNPYYWNAVETQSEVIDLLSTAASVTAMNLYCQGEVDILLDKELIPSDLLELMIQRPDVHTFDYLGTYFVRINVSKPPLNNSLVRRALSLAVDRSLLVERIARSGGIPTSCLIPPQCANYLPLQEEKFNPEEAQRLLAEAGYPGGEGFPEIVYLFNAAAGGAAKTHQKVAIELQRMWEDNLNIRVDLRQSEWKVLLSMMNNLEYDLCRSSWVADYNDPTTFLNIFERNNGNNRTGWENAEYEQILAEAEMEADLKKRALLLNRAETILVREEQPIIPLYFYKGVFCYDANHIKGLWPNPVDLHPLSAISKK